MQLLKNAKKATRDKAQTKKKAEAEARAKVEAHSGEAEEELRRLIEELRDQLGELALRLAVTERFAGAHSEETRDWLAAAGNALRARAARADRGKVSPAEGRLLRRALLRRGPWLAQIAKSSLHPLETEAALFNVLKHSRLSLYVPPEEAQDLARFRQDLEQDRWREALEALGIEVQEDN